MKSRKKKLKSRKLFQNQEKCLRISQLIFTCLNSTLETLENGVKYVPS